MKSSQFLRLINAILLLEFGSLLTCAQQCKAPATTPTAVYSKSRFPREDFAMSVVYDEDNSIYIFSGKADNGLILRYDLATEEVSTLAKLPVIGTFSPLIKSDDGSLLYFGNDPVAQRVLRYNPSLNSSSIVAELPFNLEPFQSFFTSSDSTKVYLTAYREPERNLDVYEFDTLTYCLERVDNFSVYPPKVPFSSLGNYAYAMVGPKSGVTATTLKIDRETRVLAEIPNGLEFPITFGGQAVSTNKYIYILGGYNRGSPFPTDGILQYNPVNHELRFIRIDGMPQKAMERFEVAPSMVFVEKLNRIYLFGGWSNLASSIATYYDHIWYIDVASLESAVEGERN